MDWMAAEFKKAEGIDLTGDKVAMQRLKEAAVHAVGQSGGGGLVDDALDLHAGDLARVLGGLALGVGEVGGDGVANRRSVTAKRFSISHR